ncbi:U-box domain-containing protein 33-like [Eucalyptus grandis]|uniref:U-box domain-containing protein 33-like n=1 Tax=Eucalyptus grandis TaxID=71139 RepID=UPI00192E8FE1|nr:U-box domain-containing protein 33-like [Eucalyptus grandis]
MKLKMIYPWFGLREGRGSIINQNQALKEVTMNSLNNLTERWQRLQMQNERHMKSGSIIKKIPLNFVEGSNDELYEQLDRVTAEAANAKREAYEEQINCQKAEKIATDATCRVKALEEDLRRRKGLEEPLAKEKEALEMTKNQLDGVTEAIGECTGASYKPSK